MEIFLKFYDDTDDWLTTAWLASGPFLWSLITLLLASLVLSLTHWMNGLLWPITALIVATLGLGPVMFHWLRRERHCV